LRNSSFTKRFSFPTQTWQFSDFEGKALREDAKLQSAVRELAVLGNDMAELKRQAQRHSELSNFF